MNKLFSRSNNKDSKDEPIVVVSGIDRTEEVLAAGATGFLSYDQWLLLGSRVRELLKPKE